ncbi:MFS transporter [Mucilaginibacter sp. BT774]|uniref:MFS transporter n=1 Tax=Mucilaginibacter sp. BT774 TaxID=3062276 RepID=UPI002676D170|nr:MFS transporter [Mucilaginibacter sp. BT774]MDO3629085.1 MFS transporter [Mucilaginibacter sp. BT774]
MTNTRSYTHPELTSSLLWVMAIATGLIVANLYYNQPLLDDMARTFHVGSGKAGQVGGLTQLGYATGMLFIAPLADMIRRKRLIMVCLALATGALVLVGMATGINLLIAASYLVGIFSLIPQLLVPMTAHLAKPAERGAKIGFVMSGLLLGILLSRTISGFVGAHLGWRAMFYIAAGVMVVIWLLLFFLLPEVEPEYTGTYRALMTSLLTLIKEEPALRVAAIRGALCFACFSAFWVTLTFLLRENFDKGSDVAGLFGLVGAFGALAAGLMGKLSDKMDAYKLSAFTLLLIVVSFVIFYFSAHSFIGLIIGVIVMDMGVQATHISNQSLIFALRPEARNRINTIYMVTYFIGGGFGTYLAAQAWAHYQWTGVCILGIALSIIAVIVHLLSHRIVQKIRRGV